MNYILTETHNCQEVEVNSFYTEVDARRFMKKAYCQEDYEKLAPCLYKVLSDTEREAI